MNSLDSRIVEFIEEHHVLTLATVKDNIPWCSNCFYAYHKEENIFVFTSDLDTRHAKEAMENEYVAASIVLETSVVGKIQGLQISGRVYMPDGEFLKIANKRYMKRFPFAQLMKTNLWILEPARYKMTHNRLGFGKKLFWEK